MGSTYRNGKSLGKCNNNTTPATYHYADLDSCPDKDKISALFERMDGIWPQKQSLQIPQKQIIDSRAQIDTRGVEGGSILQLNQPSSLDYKPENATGRSCVPDFQDYEPLITVLDHSASDNLNDASLEKSFASSLFQFDPIRFWELRDLTAQYPRDVSALDFDYLSKMEELIGRTAMDNNWESVLRKYTAPTYRQSVHAIIQAGSPEFNPLEEPKDVNATFIRAIKRCADPGFRNQLVKRLEGLRLSSPEATEPQVSETFTGGGKANSPVGASDELSPGEIIVEDWASFPKELAISKVNTKSLQEPVGSQVETLAGKTENLEDYISAASNEGPSSGFKHSNTPNTRDIDELEDSGVLEEIDIKIKGLYILTQLLVLQNAEWGSESESLRSASVINSDSCSEGQDEPTNQPSSSVTNTGTEEKSHTSDLKVNCHIQRQSGKRNGSSDEDNEDDRNRRHLLKKIRRCDLRSLNGRYACPFAKGDPAAFLPCLLIGRKNLAGVKEHLKRNHCNNTLPDEVRVAKRWDKVFDWCNPLWGDRPRPSPYLDIGTPWELISTVTDVGGMAFFAVSLPKIKSTFLAKDLDIPDRSSEQNLRTESSSSFGIAAAKGPRSPQVSDNEQGVDKITEKLVPINALPTVLDHSRLSDAMEDPSNLGLSVFDENIRTQNPIGAMFANLAAPQIRWPPSDALETQFNALPNYFYNEYGIDMNSQPTSLYSSLLDTFNLVGESPQVSFQANPDLSNAFRTPNTTPIQRRARL